MVANREWKEYTIGETFVLNNSTPYHKSEIECFEDKGLPLVYVSRTTSNNGIEEIVSLKNEYNINSGNRIVFGAESARFFYQEKKFITGNKMYTLTHPMMNKYIGLFLVDTLERAIIGAGFGYSLGMTSTRLEKRKIILPTLKMEPDWDYMESEGKRLYRDNQRRIMEYVQKRLKSLEVELEDKEYVSLNSVDWGVFEIGKLFKLGNGKSSNWKYMPVGNTPYIGATNKNNGVMKFVDIDSIPDVIIPGNAICFIANGDGSIGYSIYKKEPFIASVDIKYGHAEFLNKYSGNFISTVSDKIRGKYNFGYKRNMSRLKKESILLPQLNNEPDWDFMEQYMKQLELDKLKKVYDYLQQKTAD